MKKILKYVGIICISTWNTYYHPMNTKTDVLMTALFWIGITLFVNGEIEEN